MGIITGLMRSTADPGTWTAWKSAVAFNFSRHHYQGLSLSVIGATSRPYVNLNGMPCLGSERLAANLAALGVKRLDIDPAGPNLTAEGKTDLALEILDKTWHGELTWDWLIDRHEILTPKLNHNPDGLAYWEDLGDEDFLADNDGRMISRVLVPLPRVFAGIDRSAKLERILELARPIGSVTAFNWGHQLTRAEDSDLETFRRFLEILDPVDDLLAGFGGSLNGKCEVVSRALGEVMLKAGLDPWLLFWENTPGNDCSMIYGYSHVTLGLKIKERFLALEYTSSQLLTGDIYYDFYQGCPNVELGYTAPSGLAGIRSADPTIMPLEWLAFNRAHLAPYYHLRQVKRMAELEDKNLTFCEKSAIKYVRERYRGFIDGLTEKITGRPGN